MKIYVWEKNLLRTKFDRKTEGFKGYELNTKKALSEVDPQILLSWDPMPSIDSVNKYIDLMKQKSEKI